jgi:hypothetical protein
MHKYIFLFLFFISTFCSAQIVKVDSISLDFIRHKFYEGVEDEDQVDKLETFLRKKFGTDFNKIDPIITAYYGAIEALRGKHAFFPFTKLSYVNSSQDILGKAVELDPENLEIRFVRFSILHHIPGILGYSSEREDDMKVIYRLLLKRDYSMVTPEIQKGIVEFMLDSERLTEDQNNELKKLAASFALK